LERHLLYFDLFWRSLINVSAMIYLFDVTGGVIMVLSKLISLLIEL
jgi:hypothetical protein